jgi:hypothetical protein
MTAPLPAASRANATEVFGSRIPLNIPARTTRPTTADILDRMAALYSELLASASDAEQDAIIDAGLEDAIANAFVAVQRLAERAPETRAERHADYRADLAMGK